MITINGDEWLDQATYDRYMENKRNILGRTPRRESKKGEKHKAKKKTLQRKCPLCPRRGILTDGIHNGVWIKMCQTCFLSTI